MQGFTANTQERENNDMSVKNFGKEPSLIFRTKKRKRYKQLSVSYLPIL